MRKDENRILREVLKIVGIPVLPASEDLKGLSQEIHNSRSNLAQYVIGALESQVLLAKKSFEVFAENLKHAVREAAEQQEKFRNSPSMLVFRAVINRDTAAVESIVSSERFNTDVKARIRGYSEVWRFMGTPMLSDRDSSALIYETIKEAQGFYGDPERAKRYNDGDMFVYEFYRRLPELFNRAYRNRIMKKIGKEFKKQTSLREFSEEALYKTTLRHPDTGEWVFFLKEAAQLLSLTEDQLRYRVNTKKIPRTCYYRFRDIFGRPYYLRGSRLMSDALMFSESQITQIRTLLETTKHPGFFRPKRAAEYLVSKGRVSESYAAKFLRANRKRLKAIFDNGAWHYSAEQLKKV